MRLKTFCLTLAVLLAVGGWAYAQWSTDPYENTLLAYTIPDYEPVSDGHGGAVIAGFNINTMHVEAQRSDRYGFRRWGEAGVAVSNPSQLQVGVSLGATDQNHFVAVYSNIMPSNRLLLSAQKFDTLGNRLWGENGIAVKTQEDSNLDAICTLADGFGGLYLTWFNDRQGLYRLPLLRTAPGCRRQFYLHGERRPFKSRK